MKMLYPFQTTVCGKWILCGEHAVLRGTTAIALPFPSKTLSLAFSPSASDEKFQILSNASDTRQIQDLLRSLQDGYENKGISFPRLQGTLSIRSDIPLRAGLGSSAALCVALTRWLAQPLHLSKDHELNFAKELENFFHGKSSGIDVSVIALNKPISYSQEKGINILNLKKIPTFTLHDTGLRSHTRECVIQVEDFRQQDPTRGLQQDETMNQAARLAFEGLYAYSDAPPPQTNQGLEKIAQSMNLAQSCFQAWRLCPPAIEAQIKELRSRGALAVKLTGSGSGGFLVALWSEG